MKKKSSNLIKKLMIIKFILILSLLFYLSEDFYIGDKPINAEEVKPETKTTETNSTNTIKPDEDPTRKSFLNDLLDLPNISDIDKKNDAIGKYLNLAERKKLEVDKRIELLEKRELQLKQIEKHIDTKLAKLEEERLFFAQTIQKEKEIKDERLKKLISFYEKMEPKKAGPVFEKLDKDLTVALFQNLKQKTITNILENMPPERSVELTEYYGRIKSGREYDLLKELNVSLQKSFDQCKGMPAH